MKILLIDAESSSRIELQEVAGRLGECYAVDRGAAAVAAIKTSWQAREPFDLVIFDIQVAAMDGTEVLLELREMENELTVPKPQRVKIIVVTSNADQDTVATCVMAGCSGLVVKPFAPEAIIQKVAEVCPECLLAPNTDTKATQARRLIHSIIEIFERGDRNLPTLPAVIHEIEKVMENPASTAHSVAAVIERDPVLSIRVIAVANSALYRGRDRITSVSRAIPRLGFKGIQGIVAAVASHTMYEVKNVEWQHKMERLWLHSLAVAYGSRQIGVLTRFPDVEKLFLMGLIHDIGKVVLINGLSKTGLRHRELAAKHIDQVIEELHTTFGGTVLESAGLGQEFIDVAELHENTRFTTRTDPAIMIVSLANSTAREMGYGARHSQKLDLARLPAAMILHITAEHLNRMRTDLEVTVKKARIAFKF